MAHRKAGLARRALHARAVRAKELTAIVNFDRAALEARLRELDEEHWETNCAFMAARAVGVRRTLANHATDLFLRREIVAAALKGEQ